MYEWMHGGWWDRAWFEGGYPSRLVLARGKYDVDVHVVGVVCSVGDRLVSEWWVGEW